MRLAENEAELQKIEIDRLMKVRAACFMAFFYDNRESVEVESQSLKIF